MSDLFSGDAYDQASIGYRQGLIMRNGLKIILFFCATFGHMVAAKNTLRFADAYPQFVQVLGQNIKDPKFQAALKAGDQSQDKIEFEETSYRVSDLIPTQREIDVEKSLKYPLQKEKPEVLLAYLKASPTDTFAPGGPIITADGKYIIDGHHRWAQMVLVNSNIRVRAINMKVKDPNTALKITQMAIAAASGKLPIAIVQGMNLLTMNKTDFSSWVKQNISADAREAFKQAGIANDDGIVDKIWSNAQRMQTQNTPIPGAPNRGFMPQTDEAKGWMDLLKKGQVAIH